MKPFSKRKSAILAACIAIIIIAAVAGTYLLTLSNNNESDSPPGTLTLTLKPGDSTNYTVTTYENGTVTAVYPVTWTVIDANYNGTDCLALKIVTDMSDKNSNTTSLVYWYVDKDTYNGIATKTQTYVNGALVSENESAFSGPPAQVDPQTIVGQETITVAGGTFTCDKVVVDNYGNTGESATEWYSPAVPMGGLVKVETYKGTQLTTVRELISYSK
jgi:hypothetical protein